MIKGSVRFAWTRRWSLLSIGALLLCAILVQFLWRENPHDYRVPSQRRISVGLVEFEGGDAASTARIREILASDSRFDLGLLTPVAIEKVNLRKYDLLVFPGGGGRRQSMALGVDGREALREFVRDGGGYIGICAGAFLATSGYDWSLGIIDAEAWSGAREIPGWGAVSVTPRRSGMVEIELTSTGKEILHDLPCSMVVRYGGGPILSPARRSNVPDYVTWAVYRTETTLFEFQRGTMVGTPAIIAGSFGRGCVIVISPHPENTPGLEPLVKKAVALAATGPVNAYAP